MKETKCASGLPRPGAEIERCAKHEKSPSPPHGPEAACRRCAKLTFYQKPCLAVEVVSLSHTLA